MRPSHLTGKHFTLLMVFVILLALPMSSFSKAKFGKISDEEWQLGPPADYPEANAIIILDECFIDVNNRELTMERLVRIKVLTKAGIDEVGEMTVEYHGEADKIRNFKAQTITPDGKKIKVQDDAVFERTHERYIQRVFSFPQVDVGCILEYTYRNVSKRYYYLRPWYFQNRLYTMESTVSVQLELGFDYNASFFNIPPEYRQPKKEEQINIDAPNDPFKKLISYTWTLNNLLPIPDDEPYAGFEGDHRSSLKFQLVSWQSKHDMITFIDTWTNLGNELIDDYDLYLNKKNEIRQLAEEVTAGITDPRAKSRALYEYVKTEFANSDDFGHYYSYYFGKEKVDRHLKERSAPPEAKNLLLVQMHRAVGIDAYPILVSTRDNGRVYPDNPDERQFNHLLAYLEFGDGWAILDATNKNNPYGILPPSCLVTVALLIDRDQSQLIRIPDNPQQSVRIDEVTMCVDAEGKVTCSTFCSFAGYYASEFSEMYEGTPQDEFVKDWFVEPLNVTYSLDRYECGLDSSGQFVTQIDFSSEELAEKLDNNLIVKPVCYCFRENPFKSEKRFFPVDFQYPREYRSIVSIILPGDVENFQLPVDTTISITGAVFDRKSSVKDSCVTITSTVKIEQAIFNSAQYPLLRRFFSSVALASGDELVTTLGNTD
ncbi:MAG: DUF3857 and transglutaminase domain-containing protein [Candidatus Zixiibacteriota bacterium]|nr:MAG: DUF3857 and transglutaminase domain-containing protein [candidate division Zixibacteria bacterium]